jgi:hypothetical protein
VLSYSFPLQNRPSAILEHFSRITIKVEHRKEASGDNRISRTQDTPRAVQKLTYFSFSERI